MTKFEILENLINEHEENYERAQLENFATGEVIELEIGKRDYPSFWEIVSFWIEENEQFNIRFLTVDYDNHMIKQATDFILVE